MPYSLNTYDNVIVQILSVLQPKNILDIGCGAGKYGAMAKAVIPDAKRIGIEIEESYIERFNLKETYNEIRIGDAQEVLRKNLSENFDLVIIGDSIEHMPKSAGIDLLNYLTYRSQYILVLAPEFVIQHEINGVAEEAHISVWSERDFTWHDLWAWDNCWSMGLFLLRGYLTSSISLPAMVKAINNQKIPLTQESGDRRLRDINLNLISHRREDYNLDGQHVIFRPM